MKTTKILTILIIVSLFLAIPALADDKDNSEQKATMNNTSLEVPLITVPPGHIFYGLKLALENLQEELTFNDNKKLLLMQDHLENRFKEAQYLAYLRPNNTRGMEIALQEAQYKTVDIEEHRSKTIITEGFCELGTDTNNWTTGKKRFDMPYCDTLTHNQYVLSSLLNSPLMPEQSKKGLQNAINHSGVISMVRYNLVQEPSPFSPGSSVKAPGSQNISAQGKGKAQAENSTQIVANMTQGNFNMMPSAVRLMPFRTAMVYEPKEKAWYSIIIGTDEVVINMHPIEHPDYYLYPTASQLTQLENIIKNINKQKSISFSDTFKLTKLWHSVNKKQGY